MVFPFDADELAMEEGRRRLSKGRDQSPAFAGLAELPSPLEQAQAALEPLPAVKTPAPTPKRREQSGRRWLVPGLVALVAAFALVAVILYSRRGVSPPPAAPPTIVAQTEVQEPLGLSVERRGSDLRVTWNGHADIMSKADFGMLLIRGASVSRDVPLSAEELRAGTVVYSAPVDQTRFQLNVVAGGKVAREFLTVVMPQATDRWRLANSGSSSHWRTRIPRRLRPIVWTNLHQSAARVRSARELRPC
jgi:hypothetical protein